MLTYISYVTRHNFRPVYKHESLDNYLFFAGWWKVDTEAVYTGDHTGAAGFIKAKHVNVPCPGMVGSRWTDYSDVLSEVLVVECPAPDQGGHFNHHLQLSRNLKMSFLGFLGGNIINSVGNKLTRKFYKDIFVSSSSFSYISTISSSLSVTSCSIDCR